MHPRDLSIHDYSYSLPEEKIAHYPLTERDASKLLIWENETIREDIYRNIAHHIPNDSLIIFNDTKVVPARLLFQKPTGAVIEIFCLEPHAQYRDITTAMLQKGSVTWMCLIGGASKWKPGQVLEKVIQHDDKTITVHATFLGKEKDNFAVQLSWSPATISFAEVLHHTGNIPLPPYIKREAELSDAERYQTIYANMEGSVAAPTAGLHFTEYIFQQLNARHIHRDLVTLHVGAGTFKPVKSELLSGHDMHAEFIDVSTTCIERILQYIHKHITVTGTTSLRTVESLYWMGVKVLSEKVESPESLFIDQWYPYDTTHKSIPPKEALQALMNKMKEWNMNRLIAKTALLIAPGYDIKIPHALVTNFHQPQSTLLLLVAAFAGKKWKEMYEYALQHNFRFLSYGDGCLLLRH